MKLQKQEAKPSHLDLFDRFFPDRPFFHRPLMLWPEFESDGMIRVEEFVEDGTFVIKAELAGIDPEKDVEIEIADGMVHIHAERREEETTEGKEFSRRELRYGSFDRSLPLPAGVTEADVKATYKDGMLEIKLPLGTVPEETATRVPVTKL